MSLTPSMEDYLEAIYELNKTKRAVRVKDVAGRLQVTMPSVNGALKTLEARGLILHEKYESIELTAIGTRQASSISTRHRTICEFLRLVGVDGKTAECDACKIEHVLSPATMTCISEYVDRFGGNA